MFTARQLAGSHPAVIPAYDLRKFQSKSFGRNERDPTGKPTFWHTDCLLQQYTPV
jgi:hypothetical protein